MKIKDGLISMIVFLMTINFFVFGQQSGQVKSIIFVENQHLIARMDNVIRIVAQQDEPVSIKQLSSTFQSYDSDKKEKIELIEGDGYFMLHPSSFGIVEIDITVRDTVETKILQVFPIEPVGRFGKYLGKADSKLESNEFKAQKGIIARIECCGFDAKCQIFDFQVIRISNKNQVERRINNGAMFEEKTEEILLKADTGDIYIFREINYKCPGSENMERLDDMIFEIK